MKNLRKNLILVLLSVAVAALSIFAVACNGKTAKLSFEVNGGTPIAEETINKEESFTLPTPTRGAEYSFEGWYLNADFSGSAVTQVTLTEDTVVYAKWEQLYAVNLNVDGGSLSTDKVYLKKGANVYDALKDLKPTKSGYEFGAWFNGSKELAKNLRMSETALNLTAKYKAPCKVEVYLQNTTLDGYDKQDGETLYAYVGETLTLNNKYEGFSLADNADQVLSVTAGEGSVLKGYYNRNAVNLTFTSNNPNGTSQSVRINTYYGVETTLTDECYFELDGYYLSGWATSATGEIVYKSNFIDRAVYGGDKTLENDKVTPLRTTTLYAVWQKGYYDMLGGNDTIFVEAEENSNRGVAYLKRGSCYFKGTYLPKASYNQHNFEFEVNRDDRIFLRGRVNNNGSFIYYDEDRRIGSYTKFVQGEGVKQEVTIEFDKGNGITYDDNGEKSLGLYTTEGNVYYVEFMEGPKQGTTLEFVIAKTGNGNLVFLERNQEQYAMGTLKRFILSGAQIGEATAAQIELDGFFTATMHTSATDPTATQTLSYVYSDGILTLSDGQSQLVAKVFEYKGSLGYMIYNQALDITIENADGTKLTTDGLYNLTYFDGTTEYKGAYTSQSSYRGGYIISTNLNGNAKKFLVLGHEEAVLDEEGNATKDTKTVYEFTEKLLSYAEFYYKTADNVYIAPLVVLDDEQVGKANIYGVDSARNFVKVATCAYEQVEVISDASGVATYTLTVESVETIDQSIYVGDYNFNDIQSVLLVLDDATLTMRISYWYQVTDNSGNVQTMNTMYNGAESSTLVVANGMAVYTDPSNGQVLIGLYTAPTAERPYASVQMSGGTLYFEINEEELTFERLQHLPFTTVKYLSSGAADTNVYMVLDGKGNAVYTVVTVTTDPDTQEESTAKTETAGTISSTGLTSNYGSPVMAFNSDTINFKFIQLSTSSQVLFSVYEYNDPECEGKMYSGKFGNLTLDGFGYGANYTDTEGNSYDGRYAASDNLVRLTTQYGYLYFDVNDEDGSFTKRGEEFPGSVNGAYIIFDNQSIVGRYIHLDGYGNAKIFEYYTPEGSEAREVRYIDENATYTVTDQVITVSYKDGDADASYIGKISYFEYSGRYYNTFVLLGETTDSIVMVYVQDSDWTVLVLDDVGKAVRYRGQGEKETGTYKRITDELIYYVNDESSDACIYKLDPVNGNVILSKANPRNFYSEKMNTLLFTKYGFVIKDGVNICYYTTNGSYATTYRYDEDNPDANRYGFVIKENAFNLSESTIVFENKYYYTDGGYGAEFARPADNAEKYPIDGKAITSLKFAPNGGDSYRTSATVMIDGTEATGTIVKDAEGFHLTIADGIADYVFDITLKYQGITNSSYTINSMSRVTSLLSYRYMYSFVMGIFSGVYIENDYGEISFITEYNEQGNVTADYADGTFGQSSGFVDSLGNLLTIEKSDYVYDSAKATYTITTVMADGYTYDLIMKAGTFLNAGCYQTIAFIRNETLTFGEYKVLARRIIASDSYQAGGFYEFHLYQNDTEIEYGGGYIVNGTIICIVNETGEDGNVTSSTHYNITFSEKPVVGDEKTTVLPYESVTVEKRINTVYYNADKTNYVEMYDGKVVAIVRQTTSSSGTHSYSYMFARECTNNDDGSYTVTVGNNKVYTVTVNENEATITEVVQE